MRVLLDAFLSNLQALHFQVCQICPAMVALVSLSMVPATSSHQGLGAFLAQVEGLGPSLVLLLTSRALSHFYVGGET